MNLDKYMKSKINRKIVRFFHENPSSIDTTRGIATWINENVDETARALKELVKAKILTVHGDSSTAAYGYTTDTHMVSKIHVSLRRLTTKKRKTHN